MGVRNAVLLALLLTRSITRPMARGVTVSEALARGDLTPRLNLVLEVGDGECRFREAHGLSSVNVLARERSQGGAIRRPIKVPSKFRPRIRAFVSIPEHGRTRAAPVVGEPTPGSGNYPRRCKSRILPRSW